MDRHPLECCCAFHESVFETVPLCRRHGLQPINYPNRSIGSKLIGAKNNFFEKTGPTDGYYPLLQTNTRVESAVQGLLNNSLLPIAL